MKDCSGPVSVKRRFVLVKLECNISHLQKNQCTSLCHKPKSQLKNGELLLSVPSIYIIEYNNHTFSSVTLQIT